MTLGAAAAALALIPSVAAHGYITSIITGGKTYPGSNPVSRYCSTPVRREILMITELVLPAREPGRADGRLVRLESGQR